MITIYIEGDDAARNTELRKKLQEFLIESYTISWKDGVDSGPDTSMLLYQATAFSTSRLHMEVLQTESGDSGVDKLAKRGYDYCIEKSNEYRSHASRYFDAATQAQVAKQIDRLAKASDLENTNAESKPTRPWWQFWRLP